MRAAIYSRVSVDDDTASTIEAQSLICREYAIKQGWAVVTEYVDDGISGTAIGNRPGFIAMSEAAKARAFDVLIVTDVQRIARGEGLPVILKRLKFNKVRVTGVLDRSDSTAPHAAMLAAVQSIVGAQTVAAASEKVHAHLAIRAKLGKHTGGAIYGYQRRGVKDGEYFRRVVDEQQAEIVREIFTRYAGGESQRSIAKALNARAVPSPGASWNRKKRTASGLWQVSALHAMLHNPIYTGRVMWNRTASSKDPDRGVRTFDERATTEIIEVADETLRLVSDETWARVRARDTPATYGSHNARPKYPLSGLLLCAECGKPMTLCGGTNKRGYGSQRYICSTRKHHGAAEGYGCSNDMGVNRLVAEELLIEPFRARLLSDQNFLAAVTALKNRVEVFEPKGASPIADSGDRSYSVAGIATSGTDGHAATGVVTDDHPDAGALLAAQLAAIESAAACGAMSRRDATARLCCTTC